MNAFRPATDAILINMLHSSRKPSVLHTISCAIIFGNDCHYSSIYMSPTATYFQYSIRTNTQENTLCLCIDRFVSLHVRECISNKLRRKSK